MGLLLGIKIGCLAFFCEFVDSTLGMGYGTIMTPVLLLFGFSPLEIIPAILLSELITGISGALLHHREGNVDILPRTMNITVIKNKVKSLGIIESLRRGLPLPLRVALVLASCSILGAVIAVLIAKFIPRFWLRFYIGVLVILMGIMILIFRNRTFKFSWLKITSLGLIASFNKGLTGGGYGPLIASGQVLSGFKGKHAVGTTSFAEGITCLVGIIAYLLTARNEISWKLAPAMVLGAACSLPFAAKRVKMIKEQNLKLLIGILTLFLGAFTLYKTLKGNG